MDYTTDALTHLTHYPVGLLRDVYCGSKWRTRQCVSASVSGHCASFDAAILELCAQSVAARAVSEASHCVGAPDGYQGRPAVNGALLSHPFSPCSKGHPSPIRCSRTIGSTIGCVRSTDTRDLSRCSQRSRRRS